HSNEHRMRDVEQDFNLGKKLPWNHFRKKNLLVAVVLCHTQLAFQHDEKNIGRIAVANERFPVLETNLSSSRKACTLGVVKLSEKRDVKNCRERSIRNGGLLKRERRFHFLESRRPRRHIRASCRGCLRGV